MALVTILENKCKQSYACVRICPVKAIEVKATQATPFIVAERCIGCGSCVIACSSDAVVYADSKEAVKALLQSGQPVAAVCGPSISGEFSDITDYRKFVTMIKALGFSMSLKQPLRSIWLPESILNYSLILKENIISHPVALP